METGVRKFMSSVTAVVLAAQALPGPTTLALLTTPVPLPLARAGVVIMVVALVAATVITVVGTPAVVPAAAHARPDSAITAVPTSASLVSNGLNQEPVSMVTDVQTSICKEEPGSELSFGLLHDDDDDDVHGAKELCPGIRQP